MDATMYNKITIAILVAVALGAASSAMAATKHSVHRHRMAAKHQLSGAGAYGFAYFGHAYPPSVIDALRREAAGDRRCWGGNCDPVSGEGTIAN
jgi:hypothetical protein